LSKTTLICLFVDFGASHIIATSNDIYSGLFTAHELAYHIIDQAILNKGLQPCGYFHEDLLI
jgi:hypothetical protein